MTTDIETIRLVRHSEELVRYSEETAAQARASIDIARVILDIATTLRDRLPEPRPGAVATETYQVGDPDTTPDSRPWCGAVSDPGDACTREPGHAGPHAEGDGGRIIAVWDDDPESMTQAEWDALPVGTIVQATAEDVTYISLRGPGIHTCQHHGEMMEYRLVGATYWSSEYRRYCSASLTDIRVLYRPEDPS